MYNVSTVQDAFLSLGRWRKNDDPSATFNPIGDMLTGSSGMYFNDQHPLLTTNNLESICARFSTFTYPIWLIGTTYTKGDIVKVSGVYYASVTDSNTGNAVNLTAYWRVTNPLNEALRNIALSAASKVVDDWLSAKMENQTADNLLISDRVLSIFDSEKQLSGSILDTCNWNIVTTPDKSIVLTIHKIFAHFSAAITGLTIRIYKSGELYNTYTVNTTVGINSIDVTTATNTLNQITPIELEAGQEYRISYTVDGTAKPYNDIILRGINAPYFPGLQGFAKITTFTHAGYGQTGWQTAGRDYRGVSDNYGLDLEISARCDYTNMIVQNKSLFRSAFGKAVGMIALRTAAFNPNSNINRDELNMNKSSILYEVDGDSQGRDTGLGKKYKDEVKKITFDTNKLNDRCATSKIRKLEWGVT